MRKIAPAQPPASSPSPADGYWSAPAQSARCGTYAVVIGISNYQHLDGTSRCYGLKSLFVSARTAKAFFDWISTKYDSPECPLRKCWLLLSPTDEERAADPELAAGAQAFTYASPTLDTIRRAVSAWFADLQSLSDDEALLSRALLFYSGHGLEVDKDQQLLLPSDYLSPQFPSLDYAVNTYNIHSGLGATRVSRFFFIDACRNDTPELRTVQNLTGQPILTVWRGQSDRTSPILYASAPGTSAWQPTSPPGYSYFGSRLLEALTLASSDVTVTTRDGLLLINLLPVFEYVNQTVQQDLLKNNINQLDPICLGGTVRGNPTLAQIPAAIPAPPTSAPPPPPSTSLLSFDIRTLYAPLPIDVLGETAEEPEPEPPRPSVLAKITEQHFEAPLTDLHGAFGHEDVTAFYGGLEARPYVDGRWNDAERIEIVAVDRSNDGDLCNVTFTLAKPSRWYWLHAENASMRYAFLIPPTATTDLPSEGERARFRLAIARNDDRITAAQASLSTASTGVFQFAAQFYDRYRSFAQLSNDALEDLCRFGEAHANVKGSPASEIAANLAALILLRAGREALLTWLDTLIANSSISSDAAILKLELMERVNPTYDFPTIANMLRIILERGTPFMSEAVAFGMKLATTLSAESWSDIGLSEDQRKEIDRRLIAMQLAYRRGGFFTSFASSDLSLGPDGFVFTTTKEIMATAGRPTNSPS